MFREGKLITDSGVSILLGRILRQRGCEEIPKKLKKLFLEIYFRIIIQRKIFNRNFL